MYTIKSKSKTPSDFQAYNTQWIRCGQRCMLCDLSTQIASIQVYNRFTVDLKDFPTVQINTSHIYSIIPSSNRGISQAKIILKCINIHSGSDLRLRAGCFMGYTAIKFSPDHLVALKSSCVDWKQAWGKHLSVVFLILYSLSAVR